MRKCILTLVIIIVSLVAVAGSVIIVAGLPWLLLAGGSLLSPAPPSPQITYGEFPFTLVYEIDGETISIEDTLVIEYLGAGYNEGLGKYNKWNSYYKSSQMTDKDLELFNEYVDGIGSVAIYYNLGSCEYYMGLEEREPLYERISPGDIVISSLNGTRVITDDELYNDYKIRIIEKSVSSPMQ